MCIRDRGGFAAGLAFAHNDSRSTVHAFIGAAEVSAAAAEVRSQSLGTVKTVAAVGAGAGTVAADYAATINDVKNSSTANIATGAVIVAGRLTVSGEDTSTIL